MKTSDNLEKDLSFGETISFLRKKNGFTKKDVSEYVGCSQTYIADIEKKKIPQDMIVIKLAELFKYSKTKLLFLAKRESTVPEAKDIFRIQSEIFEKDLVNDYFLTILSKNDVPIMDRIAKIDLSKKIWEQIDLKSPKVAKDITLSDYLVFTKKSDNEIIDTLKKIIDRVDYNIKNNSVTVILKNKERDKFNRNVEPATLGKLMNIPLLTWVQAGDMTEYDDRYPYPGCSDEYISTDLTGEHIFALRVKGESMSPKFLDGDIVIVNPDAQVDNGDYVIVKDVVNSETMLKQLKKYSNDLLVLHPLNPSFSDVEFDKNYVIIGRVVRKQTNL